MNVVGGCFIFTWNGRKLFYLEMDGGGRLL